MLIGAVTFLGIGFLSAMALNPNGNTSPAPLGLMFGMSGGLVFYWSVLCWALGLLRRKPLVSLGLVAGALLLAFLYPAYDARSYANQRAAIATHAIQGEMPNFHGKTAVLLWGRDNTCAYNCWNISKHMAARVLVLRQDDLEAVDFNGNVNLLELPLYEYGFSDDIDDFNLADPQPEAVDFVLVNITASPRFDDAFEAFRPRGIARDGLHIDALILPTRERQFVNLKDDMPLLRLMSVSRNLASNPWLPMAGRRLYWNSADRRANNEIAQPYFCTSNLGSNGHWCRNAFD